MLANSRRAGRWPGQGWYLGKRRGCTGLSVVVGINNHAYRRPHAPLYVPTLSGHDPNDYEIGKRVGLDTINIMNKDATLNAAAGK